MNSIVQAPLVLERETVVPATDITTATHAAAAVAAAHASRVDAEGRFPFEAIAALRANGLMSLTIPPELGGIGAPLSKISWICRRLGEACSSTAMIYAMHQSQLACLIQHAPRDAWHRRLFEQLLSQQWLIASATSEEVIGGDLRHSACSVEQIDAGRFALTKRAPTISYGAHADAILVTARRDSGAPASDQVLLTVLRDDCELQKTSDWDALGMRGTCSAGFVLRASGALSQILETRFGEIAEQTMLPVSHILWSSVWIGIATDALRRGRAFFRKQVRAGVASSGATRLADATGMLRLMESRVDALVAARQAWQASGASEPAHARTIEMNDLKIRMSTMALHIVEQVMQLCGMAAYKNDTPFSIGRHLRDLHSGPIMINNDRLAAILAGLMLADRSL